MDEHGTLVVGEALIDSLRNDGGDAEPTEHVGGSPLNVACGLARLGHAATLATQIGRDERGRRIAAHLDAHGAALDPASRTDSPTSVAHATYADGTTTYRFDLVWDRSAFPDAGAHVHTGSVAATLLPGADAVERLLAAARPHATLSYDPNVRPDLMGSPDDVRDRIERLVTLADVVKASEEDLAWLFPGTPPELTAARWADAGPGLLVLTLGGRGAVAYRGATDTQEVPVRPGPVVDTVGAGDSFMAGLVSGLLDARMLAGDGTSSEEARARLAGATWVELLTALGRGSATASLTVAHAGAYAPTRAELPTT